MLETVLGQTIALVGALGLGSIILHVMASQTEHRKSRAEVLRLLGKVESARWDGHDNSSREEFRSALRDFQSSAFIARMPRNATDEYAILAQASRLASEDNKEREEGPKEFAGSIDSRLAAATRESARSIVELAWTSRIRQKHVWKKCKEKIDGQVSQISRNYSVDFIGRSRDAGFF